MLSRLAVKSSKVYAKMTIPSAAASYTPPVHRGLAQLDRTLFSLTLPFLAARVPVLDTTTFMRSTAKDFVLRIPRVGSILADPESKEHRLVLLDDSCRRDRLPTLLGQILDRDSLTLVDSEIVLPYDYWSADQILQATLPEDLLSESPTAFTQVGHIAHLNLRDEYLPHKHLIGQVILDKNKSLRTVVNKLNTIDNEFRNFQMEVLAGDNNFLVTVSESDCTFSFDFSLVYWNSRLQGEHMRLVDSFASSDVVVDAFAGVGPFAVPAGKKGCGVLASDLNPASASSLKENVRMNKVGDSVRTANEDARDYIRQSVLDVWHSPFPAYTPRVSSTMREKAARRARDALKLQSSSSTPASAPLPVAPAPQSTPPTSLAEERRLVNHFVMNLPATAIEFLDAFRGLYLPLLTLDEFPAAYDRAGGASTLPIVHCYCFTRDLVDAEDDILARATKAMGLPVTNQTPGFKLRFVRDVAPKKEMYCLEFRLTWEMVTT